MSYFLLLALCCAGENADAAAPNKKSLFNSLDRVQVVVDASPTDARGLQIVTVRMKMNHQRPDAVCDLKLELSTRDPKTKVHVIYPKSFHGSHSQSTYSAHEGEVAIQAIIQRAPGDRSPVQGRLDFRASPPGY
jgi:hypothetical protein